MKEPLKDVVIARSKLPDAKLNDCFTVEQGGYRYYSCPVVRIDEKTVVISVMHAIFCLELI